MRMLLMTFVGVLAIGGAASGAGTGDAAQGKITYAGRKCAMCHKTDKSDQKGGKMGSVLADTVSKLSAADLKSWLTDTAKMEAKLTKKPAISMSGYLKGLKPPLSEDEVTDLVAYLQSLSKPNP